MRYNHKEGENVSSYIDTLRGKICSGIPLQVHSLQQVTQGTSATEVFILRDVLKAGPSAVIEQEHRLYDSFEQILGAQTYQAIFPRVSLLEGETDHIAFLEIEWLGELLHDFLAHVRSSLGSVRETPDAMRRRLDLVDIVIEHSLAHLETLFTTTQTNNPSLARAFLSEMLTALRVNLAQASQLTREVEQFLTSIRDRYIESLLENAPVSLCHRDLATDNIYFQTSDEHSQVVVKFADPRNLLPFLSSADVVGHGATAMDGWGIAAIDLAALWISLYREEQELLHFAPSLHLTAYRRVQDAVERWCADKRFNHAFFALSLATCISLYVSCKCDYCTAPERNWLYEQMVAMCHEQLHVCALLLEDNG